MEIIIPGSYKNKNDVRTFTCKECGCIFKAGREEYKYEFSKSEDKSCYSVKCPFCESLVSLRTEDAKKQENVDFLFENIGYKRRLNVDNNEIIYDNDDELCSISYKNGYFSQETFYGHLTNFSTEEIIACAELAKRIKGIN